MQGVHSVWEHVIGEDEEMEMEEETMYKPWTMQVHKFGGSSMTKMDKVGVILRDLVSEAKHTVFVVVSAIGGVTNALIDILHQVLVEGPSSNRLESIVDQHKIACRYLCSIKDSKRFDAFIDADVQNIRTILQCVSLCKSISPEILDLVSGYGELWSSQILTFHLHTHSIHAIRLDARDVITLHPRSSEKPNDTYISSDLVDWEESQLRWTQWTDSHRKGYQTIVSTGYICRRKDGVPSTLGRNGSDFSASIFGALIRSRAVHIWTDVEGVFSCDPRVVKDARRIPRLSYEETGELARLGGKVIHPNTMAPATWYGIPIHIRSTFAPEDEGTVIRHKARLKQNASVCLSVVENLALVSVDCVAYAEGLDLFPRAVQSLFLQGVRAIAVIHSVSDESLMICVKESQVEDVCTALRKSFYREVDLKKIKAIVAQKGLSLIAAVKRNMVNSCGTFLEALNGSGIPIHAIVQGAGGQSVSAVIPSEKVEEALFQVHNRFYP